MDVIGLMDLVKKGESEKLEFKTTVDSSAGKTMCAFLNTAGGKLLVGVEDGGHVVGCGKDAEEKLANMLANITPRVNIAIEKVMVGKVNVIYVEVPKSDRLHSIGNIGYVRIGSTTRALMLDEIIEKAAESLLLSFDEAICIDAKLSDLSQGLLDKYLQERNKFRNVSAPTIRREKLWEMLKATHKGKVTNAGVLFFCEYPERFHPEARLRFIEFSSQDMTNVVEEHTFFGSIWEISDSVGDLLKKKIGREEVLHGFHKVVAPHFPLEALREALNNALVHRNYFRRSDILIFLFPDRLEIANPGSFPPDITPQMPAHNPRNRLLSQ